MYANFVKNRSIGLSVLVVTSLIILMAQDTNASPKQGYLLINQKPRKMQTLGESKGDALKIKINLDAIREIESSGVVVAYNKKSQARGSYQITPIVLKSWNQRHPKEKYTGQDLFIHEINEKIASWYLSERIPEILRANRIPVNVENLLISYNAGWTYTKGKKKLPQETRGYIQKYNRMTKK
jgi:hypothetical protein